MKVMTLVTVVMMVTILILILIIMLYHVSAVPHTDKLLPNSCAAKGTGASKRHTQSLLIEAEGYFK